VLAIGLLGAGIAWLLTGRRPAGGLRRPPRGTATALLAVALLAGGGARTVARYERHRLDGERAAAALADLAGGRATRVAYLGWNQPYLFCGERLQNALFMVPGGRHLDAMFYRWGSDPVDPYQWPAVRRRWLRNLDALRVEFVVWVAQGASGGPERRWMERSAFERRYSDGRTEIWQVRPEPAKGLPAPTGQAAPAARSAA
jgi:hypothetical protein